MEEDFLRDADDVPFQRRLSGTVYVAPTCDSTVRDFRVGTLVVSFDLTRPNAEPTLSLFAQQELSAGHPGGLFRPDTAQRRTTTLAIAPPYGQVYSDRGVVVDGKWAFRGWRTSSSGSGTTAEIAANLGATVASSSTGSGISGAEGLSSGATVAFIATGRGLSGAGGASSGGSGTAVEIAVNLGVNLDSDDDPFYQLWVNNFISVSSLAGESRATEGLQQAGNRRALSGWEARIQLWVNNSISVSSLAGESRATEGLQQAGERRTLSGWEARIQLWVNNSISVSSLAGESRATEGLQQAGSRRALSGWEARIQLAGGGESRAAEGLQQGLERGGPAGLGGRIQGSRRKLPERGAASVSQLLSQLLTELGGLSEVSELDGGAIIPYYFTSASDSGSGVKMAARSQLHSQLLTELGGLSEVSELDGGAIIPYYFTSASDRDREVKYGPPAPPSVVSQPAEGGRRGAGRSPLPGGGAKQGEGEEKLAIAAKTLASSWLVCWKMITGDETGSWGSPEAVPCGKIQLIEKEIEKTSHHQRLGRKLGEVLRQYRAARSNSLRRRLKSDETGRWGSSEAVSCSNIQLIEKEVAKVLTQEAVAVLHPSPIRFSFAAPSGGGAQGKPLAQDITMRVLQMGVCPPSSVGELWGLQVEAGSFLELEVLASSTNSTPQPVIFSIAATPVVAVDECNLLIPSPTIHSSPSLPHALASDFGVVLTGSVEAVHCTVSIGVDYVHRLAAMFMEPGLYQMSVCEVAAVHGADGGGKSGAETTHRTMADASSERLNILVV
eukprot:gene5274-18511_t